ncbi:hypothetical protein Cgig2_011984 [Carnegiea gigantea]|uniref:Uncharacterized protein n=1 Tax=Carnegiea gigantea TaxID=171969 RepID=A0A9Q1GGC1_9CARY|nr:hypothetical protein Cgig2_011984 [Carnegiea gigantea]
MTTALGNSREINGRPDSAALSSSDLWWNARTVRPGIYRLTTSQENPIPRAWYNSFLCRHQCETTKKTGRKSEEEQERKMTISFYFKGPSLHHQCPHSLDLPHLMGRAVLSFQPPRPPCPSLVFPRGGCTWLLSPPPFVAPPEGPGPAPPRGRWSPRGRESDPLRRETDQHKRATKKEKKKKEEKIKDMNIFTLTMATCSSVTLGGLGKAEGARSHDLARCSTSLDLTEGSAPIKSITPANLLADPSPTRRWGPVDSLEKPPVRLAPLPRQRPPDRSAPWVPHVEATVRP